MYLILMEIYFIYIVEHDSFLTLYLLFLFVRCKKTYIKISNLVLLGKQQNMFNSFVEPKNEYE